MKKSKYYYHFTGTKLRDGRPLPKVGEWIEHEGKLVPCKSGLHASEHPFDALKFAPGPFLHVVELGGKIIPHENNKVVARRRKILKSIDATELLRKFSRDCALEVIGRWNPPPVVRKYLETGRKDLRKAARAASAAAWSAAESASASSAMLQKYRNKFSDMVEEAFAAV